MGFAVGDITIDPQNPATIYTSVAGYIFKSLDAGATWNQVAGWSGLRILAIDLRNQGTFYVSGGAGRPGVVLKSSDGGATWQVVNVGTRIDGPPVLLAIDPHNADTMYAAGLAGPNPTVAVFKSTNGGATWSAIASGISDSGVSGLVIDPKNTSTLYITTVPGVVKSTDGGRNWNMMNSGLSACCRGPVVIDPQNPATLYTGRIDGLIYKSTNGGRSWTALTLHAGALTIDPQNSNTLYAGTISGASKSTDGGATWTAINSGLRTIPVGSALIDSQNPDTLYAVGGINGTSKSGDAGQTWGAIFPGIIMAIDPQTPSNLYGAMRWSDENCRASSGVFKSGDAGMNWVDTGFRDCFYAVIVDPQNPTNVYAATYLNGVVKSIDAGGSWNPVNAGLPARQSVSALGIDPQNPQILYAVAYLTLFKSTDGGMSWNSTGLKVTKEPLSAVVIDPLNTNTIYAVDSSVPDGLWKSVDGGASWQNLSPSPEGAVTPTVYAIAVSPKNPGTLYVGTNRGVITSTDGGENWLSLASDIGSIQFLVIDPKHQDTLYAGGSGGMFRIGPPTVTAIAFDATVVTAGASYTATIAGLNLSDDTYFDLQVRGPLRTGSAVDIVSLNWQIGTSASHTVPAGFGVGTWTVDGVRAHQDPENHTGAFDSVSGTITISP
jgi:photosystem II stability/assembly factor-like uncharacterized protein